MSCDLWDNANVRGQFSADVSRNCWAHFLLASSSASGVRYGEVIQIFGKVGWIIAVVSVSVSNNRFYIRRVFAVQGARDPKSRARSLTDHMSNHACWPVSDHRVPAIRKLGYGPTAFFVFKDARFREKPPSLNSIARQNYEGRREVGAAKPKEPAQWCSEELFLACAWISSRCRPPCQRFLHLPATHRWSSPRSSRENPTPTYMSCVAWMPKTGSLAPHVGTSEKPYHEASRSAGKDRWVCRSTAHLRIQGLQTH